MKINIRVGANNYSIICNENEHNEILDYADKLDNLFKEIKENIDTENDSHILIIAGIMLQKELAHKHELLSGDLKNQLYSEDDIYNALGEQMDNLANYIQKITKKIQDL
jgi:cell division protein ZapA (FtsZ GTPase activity inhibitor)